MPHYLNDIASRFHHIHSLRYQRYISLAGRCNTPVYQRPACDVYAQRFAHSETAYMQQTVAYPCAERVDGSKFGAVDSLVKICRYRYIKGEEDLFMLSCFIFFSVVLCVFFATFGKKSIFCHFFFFTLQR